MNITSSTFLDTVTTKYEQDKTLHALDSIIHDLYSKKSVADIIGEYCNAHQKEVLMEMLGESVTMETAKTKLQEVHDELAAVPVVTLEVAVDPSANLVKKASSKLELLLGKKVVIEFKVKHEILGGAVIEYDGKYMDHSLRKNLISGGYSTPGVKQQ